jgi:PAS domain S-box-containing protein
MTPAAPPNDTTGSWHARAPVRIMTAAGALALGAALAWMRPPSRWLRPSAWRGRAPATPTDAGAARLATRETAALIDTFFTFFERGPAAFGLVTPALRFARANEALCRLTGFDAADLPGRPVAEALAPFEPALTADARQVLATAHPVTRTVETGDGAGDRRCYHVTHYPIRLGERILGVALALEDVTDQRRGEEALRESEERFRLVTRATRDAVRDWHVRSNRVWWSDALSTLFGYEPAAVEPTFDWWVARIHPDDLPSVLGGARAVETGSHDYWTSEYRFRRADGDYAVVRDRGFVLRDERGHPLRVVGAMSDITAERHAAAERRALLERERAARAEAERVSHIKDEFLATLSHELRTPLNAMLGWCELLLTGRLDAAQTARAVEIVRRNAQAQARLIGDLLDMSRIITGKMRLDVVTTDLAVVVSAAVETVRPAAEARHVTLVESIEAGVRVNGDPARLQQVAWNLLSNAVKFTPEGGQVTVRVRRTDSMAEISVTDTGLGIHPSMIDEVFDRFRQVDASPMSIKEISTSSGAS